MSALAAEWGGPEPVMKLTPRQFVGWLSLSKKRRGKDLAILLSIAAAGARGKEADVKKQIKDWQK